MLITGHTKYCVECNTEIHCGAKKCKYCLSKQPPNGDEMVAAILKKSWKLILLALVILFLSAAWPK